MPVQVTGIIAGSQQGGGGPGPVSSLTFVQSSAAADQATCPLPTGWQPDDLLLYWFVRRRTDGGNAFGGDPAGYTQLASDLRASGDRHEIHWKIAEAGESAPDLMVGLNVDRANGVILAYRPDGIISTVTLQSFTFESGAGSFNHFLEASLGAVPLVVFGKFWQSEDGVDYPLSNYHFCSGGAGCTGTGASDGEVQALGIHDDMIIHRALFNSNPSDIRAKLSEAGVIASGYIEVA